MNKYFRFLLLSALFILAPLGIAGILLFSLIDMQKASYEQRGMERLQKDFNSVLCEIFPSYYVQKRLEFFANRVIAMGTSSNRLEADFRNAVQKWGFLFDPYIFGDDGKLITPNSITVRSRAIAQKFWNILTDERKGPALYKKQRRLLNEFFGCNFDEMIFSGKQENLISTSFHGKPGSIFWKKNSKSRKGGVILVSRINPGYFDILKIDSLVRKNRISLFVQDERKNISSWGVSTDRKERNEITLSLRNSKEPLHELFGKLWVFKKHGNLKFLAGRAPKSSKWERGKTVIFTLCTILGFLGLTICFRWEVLKQDLYLSIKFKLSAVFMFTLLIPIMGLSFLTLKTLQDSEKVRMTDLLRFSREKLTGIDEGFLDEQKEILKECRWIRDRADFRKDPGLFDRQIADLIKKDSVSRVTVLDLACREIFDKTNRPWRSESKNFLRIFFTAAVKKHLRERLNASAFKLKDLALFEKELSEAKESIIPYFLQNPDQILTLKLGDRFHLLYFDFFSNFSHPAALVVIYQWGGNAIRQYLQKCVSNQGSSKNSKVVLYAYFPETLDWYSPDGIVPPGLGRFSQQISVLQHDLLGQIKWKNQKFHVVGVPAKKLERTILFALFPDEEIQKPTRRLRQGIGLGFFIMLFIALLTGYSFSETFLKPIAEFAFGISALKQQNTKARISISQKDEFGELAHAFNSMMNDLDDVSAARLVQEELFPQNPINTYDYGIFGITRPATHLGGDYYDYHIMKDRFLLGIIGDATGHGVPAALIIAMTKALVTDFGTNGSDPSELLDDLNCVILSTVKRKRLVTLGLIWIDLVTHTTTLFNCGHPYPFLIDTEGGARFLEGSGSPIGGKKLSVFPITFSLQPGERLVFYTDGLIESFADSTTQNSFETFKNFVRARPPLSLEKACADILDNHPFTLTGAAQPDDFTVLIIERKPALLSNA